MKQTLKNFTSVLLSILVGFGMAGFSLSGSAAATLKTAPVDKKNYLEFSTLLIEAEMAGILERGVALKTLDNQVVVLKADMTQFVTDLKANGEAISFDTMVLAHAKSLGGALLVNELKRAGGPFAILSKAGSYIDADLKQFKLDLPPFISLLELTGISDAHAMVRGSTVCGVFWYVVSFGYGYEHAYYSCYR